MTKMPEPVELSSPMDERAIYGYTADQLKQYGRDLLEEAIQHFESRTNIVFSAQRIQEELRKMKEQIK
jgi:hypothetical protein